MIADINVKEDDFQNMLKKLYETALHDDFFSKIKQKAWDQFKVLGLPNRKQEAYRYIALRKLFEKQYETQISEAIQYDQIESLILPESKESYIVLVNGCYSKELSNTKALTRVSVSSLNDASKVYSSFLTNHLSRSLKEEKDAFVCLNTLEMEKNVFIYLPPKTVVENPIQIIHVLKSSPGFFNPRIQVFAGAGSSAQFVFTQKNLNVSAHFVNQLADFTIEDNAHIHYTQVLSDMPESLWHFDATRATLKKECSFHAFNVTNGSATVRTDYKVTLTGENGSSSLNGLSLLDHNHELHTHILMEHQAPFCSSRQLFKTVLDDFSKSSFEGKILVRQAAQKTDAFQLNSNLLLSDSTNAYSKPNLEIFADDVKASHGATFGQLDSEQLFCLKSRGIGENQAKNLLILGFCKEIIDLITIPSLQQMLMNQAKQYKYKS